jgi:hypothetical protein
MKYFIIFSAGVAIGVAATMWAASRGVRAVQGQPGTVAPPTPATPNSRFGQRVPNTEAEA